MPTIPGEKHPQRVAALPGLMQLSTRVLAYPTLTADTLEAALNGCITSTWLADLLHHELGALRADSHYTPIRSYYSGLEIMDNEAFTLQLFRVKVTDLQQRTLLTAFSNDKVIVSLCPGGLLYACYAQTTPEPTDVFDVNKVLVPVETAGTLSYLHTIQVRKHVDVLSYLGTGNGADVLALAATVKAPAGFDWEYEQQSLRPRRLVGDPASCRLEHTCKMLGELADDSSLPVLTGLLRHPQHHVRWEAARSLMLIDTEQGVQALHSLSNDTHPDIQRAVQKAFSQLAISF